jgi:hypothetical protein
VKYLILTWWDREKIGFLYTEVRRINKNKLEANMKWEHYFL